MQEDEATGTLLLAVFDGHGEAGDGVSQFFRAQLPPTLFAHPEFPNTPTYEGKRAPKTGEQSLIGTGANGDDAGAEGWEKALVESVQFLEKNLLRDSSIDTEFSGTTAVINLIRGDLCLTANIGDSRITLGRSDGSGCKAIPLSDDHKPDRPDEKERIIKRGGRVFAVEYDDGIDGPFRVWLGHMDVPGLAMARSLGDSVAHSCGVISTPEYTTYKIGTGTGSLVQDGAITDVTLPEWEADRYLVIASDGLWEFMTDQEVIDICASQTDARRTVDLLIMEANGRWMKEEQVIDDTTVIVATVGPADHGSQRTLDEG